MPLIPPLLVDNTFVTVIKPIPGTLFRTFERQTRDFLVRIRKTAIKAVYFTKIT